jgi:uncharacterized protein YndB with AHSA1/START domain
MTPRLCSPRHSGVEVPMNEYPTTQSFAEALERFGNEVTSVNMLAEMADADEATVLYDMDVRAIGTVRVVEHFTVDGGKIVRLRQIHDTVAIRAASGQPDAAVPALSDEADPPARKGYTASFDVSAPVAKVFEALTTDEGLASWWASSATGCGSVGATIVLGFSGLEVTISFRIDSETYPTSVIWTCLRHTGLPDWDGTTVVFELRGRGTDTTELSFEHVGLVDELDCYEQCHAGWDHFLASLRSYVEIGSGSPFSG